PVVWGLEAGDEPQQSGLPAAGGTEEAEDLALVHGQVQLVYSGRGVLRVALRQVRRLDDRVGDQHAVDGIIARQTRFGLVTPYGPARYLVAMPMHFRKLVIASLLSLLAGVATAQEPISSLLPDTTVLAVHVSPEGFDASAVAEML